MLRLLGRFKRKFLVFLFLVCLFVFFLFLFLLLLLLLYFFLKFTKTVQSSNRF